MLGALIRCCTNFEGRHKVPKFVVAVPAALVAAGAGMLVQDVILSSSNGNISFGIFCVVWFIL
jgi:hypothetical protein